MTLHRVYRIALVWTLLGTNEYVGRLLVLVKTIGVQIHGGDVLDKTREEICLLWLGVVNCRLRLGWIVFAKMNEERMNEELQFRIFAWMNHLKHIKLILGMP